MNEFSEISKQNLVDAKINILRTFPFMSFMTMSSVYVSTPNLPTMAAGFRGGVTTIYINEEFLNTKLTDTFERSFVIAHEIMHLFFLHIGRQKAHNYNSMLWNIATDFFINNHLIKLDNNKLKFPEFGGLKDPKYNNMSSDDIYHAILEENDQDMAKALDGFGGIGDGDGSPFDGVSADDLTAGELAQLKGKIATSLSAARESGDGNSNEIIKELEEMLMPTLNWVDILNNFITTSYQDNLTYSRCNRRSGEVIFPCLKSERINVTVGIDTSGSMSHEDIRDALSELKGIVQSFDSWIVTLLSCDTEPHFIGEYDSNNGDTFTDIDLSLIGGGGTDMDPIIRYVGDSAEPSNVIVILTDGYMDDVTNITGIPSIIVITKNGDKNFTSISSQVININ